MKPGVMRVLNFDFFNTHENFINDQRDFLVSLVEDPDIPLATKEISIKLILLLGNTRASGEDFLVAFNLIKAQDLSINVYNELSVSNILDEAAVESASKSDDAFKVKKEGINFIDNFIGSSYKEVFLLTGSGTEPSRSNYSSMTFDENYWYLYNQSNGLYKIGIENSVTVKEGIFYGRYMLNDGLQRSIVYLNDKIYWWSHENTEFPLSVFDKSSLNCATNDEFKKIFNRQKKNLGKNINKNLAVYN